MSGDFEFFAFAMLLLLFVGACAVALVIWIMVRLSRLEAQIALLRPNVVGPATLVPEAAPAASPPQHPPAYVAGPAKLVPEAAPAASPEPRRRIDFEAIAGGRILNIAGAIALVTGIGFLLGYLIQHRLITEWVQVGLGLLVGAALVGLGASADARGWRTFSQGVIGAGIAVLYLAGYAAFSAYHLVPFAVAFTLMVIITGAAFALALRFDSLVVALIGWAGGFLTPYLLNTGTNNQVGLAAYIFLLDATLVGVVLRRPKWFVLEPLGLFATYIVSFAWFQRFFDRSEVYVSTLALLSFWLLFFAMQLRRAVRSGENSNVWSIPLGVVNVVTLWVFLHAVLAFDHMLALQNIIIGLAAVYGLAYWVTQRLAPINTVAIGTYACIGVGLAWSLVFLPLSESNAGLSAAVIAAAYIVSAIVIASRDAQPRFAAALGDIVHTLGAVFWVAVFAGQSEIIALRFAISCIAVDLCVYVFKRLTTSDAWVLGRAMVGSIFFGWMLLGIGETYRWVVAGAQLAPWLVLNAIRSAHAVDGQFASFKPMQLLTGSYAVVLAVTLHVTLGETRLRWELALVGMAVYLAICYVAVLRVNPNALGLLAEFAWVATLLGVIAAFSHYFGYRLIAALTAIAALNAVLGLRPAWRFFRLAALAAVFVAFFAMFEIHGFWTYRPIATFVPLINHRALAGALLVAVIVLIGIAFRRAEAKGAAASLLMRIWGIAAAVLLLTLDVKDAFERVIRAAGSDVYGHARYVAAINGQELSVSLLWLVCSIAIIAAGISQRVRAYRIIALVLFYATALKVFFIDLSNLDALYRVLAFIALGLVLLGTSWVYQRLERTLLKPPGHSIAEAPHKGPASQVPPHSAQ